MLALERQKIILEYVASNGVITTKHLSELTGASLATLRRDLNLLDRQGFQGGCFVRLFYGVGI